MQATKIRAEEHLGLVTHIALKYKENAYNLDDIISEGRIGLVKAANTFDESKGFQFATYASRCINNEILMFFRREKKHHGFSLDAVRVNDDGDEYSAAEFMEEYGYYDEYTVEDEAEIANLRAVIARLKERERTIIELRYFGEKTQTEVSQVLGVSQSYISRLEKRILNELRCKLECRL
jgi:RNA polymerase sporulation-specific sigma factor